MKSRGSITGPLVLILVGTVFLLRAVQPNFQIGELFVQSWPYLLIVWGAVAFLEVTFRALRPGPIPTNGVSGGGWALVIFICIFGYTANQIHRPDNWWHQVGFTRGFEDVMGEDHQYSISPQTVAAGAEPHIIIESFRGDAKVTGGESNDVTLSGQKSIHSMDSGAADVADKQSAVELIHEGNTLIVRCHQDRASSQAAINSNLELTVPKGATVEATGTRGDFDISNILGDVTISSANAGVRLQDVGGRVKVETSRSDVIRCENVKGDVDLRGHGDDVELLKIDGQVTISGDYRGSVSLRELAKPVRVQNERTQLAVQQIPGEVRLDRGNFSAENVVGPVILTTHATDVSFDGFTAGLDLTVDKGDVEIRPNRSPLSKIAVHSTSGNIELSLPEAAKFALNASTERGEVENDFGNALTEVSEGHGAKLEGTVGAGPDLNLVTNHGTITVRKSAKDEKSDKEKTDEESKSDAPGGLASVKFVQR
jgi:DUF4097 and DUF4098 domain-containing protein YvlB